ncbi:IMS domain-containing protein [Chroococcidiopsis sp. TS-821]|uniref:IMS domain-containing protein n=1 Tax=Chroococcidiopsis sp. TS-821 TaxID=1378066 RepID=UPI000CEECF23|nr:IMS domain-containing protein [Chroococcidiopsis sp. TS-821]PPS40694.1 molecular chaperone DnaJ [Chroococcidiopsis sp. TS-821]
MQIPLDYYRILGLPVAASHEQLQQAYRDRLIQLPRREYSTAAIAARKQLIEQAYAVLSEPSQRKIYDTNYFAHRYEQQPTPEGAQSKEVLVEDIFAPHTPIIEIADNLFAGALLILQELGEYELVLTLGNSYLNNSHREQNNDQLRADVVLTVALAYLELGREQWQQKNYESAANSLQNGEQRLTREGIFLNLRNDIAADLNKLRPYRILALLAEPEGTTLERRHLGLKLLQDLLNARGGIDGTGDDGSGLSLDDFLRFIQQLRTYLTVSEQQTLFEAESKRPSAVASYLAVYALIARGFTQRMPVLISQAKQLLQHLAQTKRQDVYLEQAIATLLLGQTVEANRALELSQEREPLEFIREYSQGSPDLLPGLCLYAERWLQNEVFPQFCDLKHRQASLKEYFADEHVQTYLEALPNQIEASQKATASVATSTTHKTSQPQRQKPNRTRKTTANVAVSATNFTTANTTGSATLEPTTARPTSSSPPNGYLTVSQTSAIQRVRVPQRKRRKRKAFAVKDKTAIALLALAGLIGSVFILALLGQAFGWLRQTLYPAPPPLPGEQLAVQLNQPPLAIPSPGSQFLPVVEPLDAATAEQVIHSWLSAKAAAFSTDYAIESLQNILVDPALAQWQQLVRSDRANNRHRQFQHSLKIDAVQVNATNPDLATVQATVSEVARIYDRGQLNQRASYADENLRVRYDLVRRNNAWRIRQMRVLN